MRDQLANKRCDRRTLTDDIQLIKIHFHSGKVTLLGYEEFYKSPLPQLKERVKIKMAEQEVDFFDYIIPDKRPLLLDKISYIDETFEDYKKQKIFDALLKKYCFELKQANTTITHILFSEHLERRKLSIKGYNIRKVN